MPIKPREYTRKVCIVLESIVTHGEDLSPLTRQMKQVWICSLVVEHLPTVFQNLGSALAPPKQTRRQTRKIKKVDVHCLYKEHFLSFLRQSLTIKALPYYTG